MHHHERPPARVDQAVSEEALTTLEQAGRESKNGGQELKLQRGVAWALWRCPHLSEKQGPAQGRLTGPRTGKLGEALGVWAAHSLKAERLSY